MAIAKTHCCNSFGWLYIDAEAAREAMDVQLAFRDKELAADKHASGEPADFKAWAIRQVRGLTRQPGIAQQIEQRRANLQRELDRLDADEARRALAHHRAVEAIERDLDLLNEVLPVPAAPVTVTELGA